MIHPSYRCGIAPLVLYCFTKLVYLDFNIFSDLLWSYCLALFFLVLASHFDFLDWSHFVLPLSHYFRLVSSSPLSLISYPLLVYILWLCLLWTFWFHPVSLSYLVSVSSDRLGLSFGLIAILPFGIPQPSWSWWYGNWIYSNLCNQCLSPLKLWNRNQLRRGVLDTTLCDEVCQWLAAGRWFSPGTPVSSTNKYSWNIVKSGVKHNVSTPNPLWCHVVLLFYS